VTGETDHNLRGDYSRMRPDYTVDQDWDAYSAAEHDLWRRLYRRQEGLVRKYGCDEFVETLDTLNFGEGIPRFDKINAMLGPKTNWKLVAVPGLLPDLTFFDHLANRRFPVTVWLRNPEEFDYIVEPDIFHDFFGHVPMLFNPVFADYMQAYGRGGIKAHALGAIEMLARLYWYTVEFGLIRTAKGLKAYGAGILSSAAEVKHAIESKNVERLPFEAATVMYRPYEIDRLQNTYFVLDDFRQLFEAAQTRIA
jgi:phenylalanine-4-hydroxylase